jgi:nicotinamide mononucleotide transporter
LGLILYGIAAVTMFVLALGPNPPFSLLETIGFLSGVIWIALLIKEDVWGWLAGIISSGAYVFFFYRDNLFGDAALNVLYVILGILGWIWWAQGKDKSNGLRVEYSKSITLAVLAVGVVIGTSLLVPHFRAGGSPVPIPDASLFCTAVAAQYLQARKKIENWPLWVVVNAGYVAVYLYRGYYPTAILTVVFAIMAVVGWKNWLSLYKIELAASAVADTAS